MLMKAFKALFQKIKLKVIQIVNKMFITFKAQPLFNIHMKAFNRVYSMYFDKKKECIQCIIYFNAHIG